MEKRSFSAFVPFWHIACCSLPPGGTEMSEEQTELRFLTLAEAAIILQVSKRTILRMIQKKEVPALKVGGQWRLRESQLRRWAEEKENVVAAFE
jgi:excisionase family DNA binding protein